MQLYSTTERRYGSIASLLHWATALAFLALYCIVYSRNWYLDEDSAAGLTALQLHQAIGLSVAVFFVWRIWWRLTATKPLPIPGPRYAQRAASVSHAAFYFFMIAMPVSGYLYATNPTNFLGLLVVPAFGDTPLCHWLVNTFDLSLKTDIRPPNRFFHRDLIGPLVLPVLIGAHVLAALYHHYVLRDDTLTRMLSPSKVSNEISAEAASGGGD